MGGRAGEFRDMEVAGCFEREIVFEVDWSGDAAEEEGDVWCESEAGDITA